MASIIVTGTKNLDSANAELLISDENLQIGAIHVNAPAANGGTVYFGDSNVSSTRFWFKLEPGEEADFTGLQQSGYIDDIDLSTLYVRGTLNDDIIYGYQKRSN